jgi:PelA/Pel-15E family pectate lyase
MVKSVKQSPLIFIFTFLASPLAVPAAVDEDLVATARAALERGCDYFHSTIATYGGYLWWYSEDLREREGEGQATPSQIWVQPPGTPSVGMAYLAAYKATGDQRYLHFAVDAAHALCWGQLESGGWDYLIDFDPVASQKWYYRHDVGFARPEGRRNTSTLDDDTTQSALRLLMAVDQETDDPGWNGAIRRAVVYGLDQLLAAQFENGAWPQRFPRPKGYGGYATFNDNALCDCISTLLQACHYYGEEKYLAAAKRGGDFIILSQGKPPQAGWAQQYDDDLKPAWARKFEPPSWSPAEASSNIRMLTDLYLETGEEKYLEPIPAAIAWLETCQIGENLWPRFVELETNRPLYFTKDYKLVYTADDLPTHYSFQGSYGIPGSVAYYQAVQAAGREGYLAQRDRERTKEEKAARLEKLAADVRALLAAQDAQGRWVEDGKIQCHTFNRHVERLAEFLKLAAEAGS